MSDPVYIDYNATTPVAPEVADAIKPWLREHFGNPSSSHLFGQRAKQSVFFPTGGAWPGRSRKSRLPISFMVHLWQCAETACEELGALIQPESVAD